jgi:MoxR-like ATPase
MDTVYLPDDGLTAAVEVARDLHMPLLVTGEPGTGKTQLAYWIATQLGSRVYRFNTKTTSVARDLFYRYDAIRHFGRREDNPLDFISFEALGQAILSGSPGQRAVVLVDEIDKAPRDFPNDVLFQFEAFAFRIEEATEKDIRDFDFSAITGKKSVSLDRDGNLCRAEGAEPPFLLLTSNSEKNLPDAFLRRCVFYHIEFPNETLLRDILEKNARVSPGYLKHLDAVIRYFLDLRKKNPRKLPATAELIRWMESLEKRGVDWDLLAQDPAHAVMLPKLRETLPVLLKNKEDWDKFKP